MERLTVADDILENGKRRCYLIDGREVRNHAMEFYWRLKEYEDLGLTPERIEAMQQHNHILIEQLSEYQRLEEQGLLLKLPCKVGDKAYYISAKHCNHDYCSDNCFECEYSRLEIIECTFNVRMFDDIGITIFPTLAEAEKALTEMRCE